MKFFHQQSFVLWIRSKSNSKPPTTCYTLFAIPCFLIFAFCFFLSSTASAQRFIGGIAAGMNITQVDGDEIFGYRKIGFNGGPYVKLMLDRKQRFSVTMELLYTQKGAYQKNPPPEGILIPKFEVQLIDQRYPELYEKIYFKLRADYLELPVLVHFEDPKSKFGIGVGISWARLVYIREYLMDFRIHDSIGSWARRLTTDVNSGRYHKNDWGIMADVKIPIYKGLKFNFRFQYSLAPFGKKRQFYSTIGNNPSFINRWPFHNTLTVRIIYSFNEKYIENDNYDYEGNRVGAKWIRDPDVMKW